MTNYGTVEAFPLVDSVPAGDRRDRNLFKVGTCLMLSLVAFGAAFNSSLVSAPTVDVIDISQVPQVKGTPQKLTEWEQLGSMLKNLPRDQVSSLSSLRGSPDQVVTNGLERIDEALDVLEDDFERFEDVFDETKDEMNEAVQGGAAPVMNSAFEDRAAPSRVARAPTPASALADQKKQGEKAPKHPAVVRTVTDDTAAEQAPPLKQIGDGCIADKECKSGFCGNVFKCEKPTPQEKLELQKESKIATAKGLSAALVDAETAKAASSLNDDDDSDDGADSLLKGLSAALDDAETAKGTASLDGDDDGDEGADSLLDDLGGVDTAKEVSVLDDSLLDDDVTLDDSLLDDDVIFRV